METSMKKLSDFLVNKRLIFFIFTLLCSIASVFLLSRVNVITDMTEFLPKDSSMRKGIDLMKEEFPSMAETGALRVMTSDLSTQETQNLLSILESMEYVASVEYQADSTEYNRDNHSLFILNVPYEYDSPEMNQVEETLSDSLSKQYSLVYDTGKTEQVKVPIWILVLAVVILLIILFFMCHSWIEPFLFLATIGIAILINTGTNAFLPGVSETTYSIAAVLQLVLSMDYSIILINRYREEQKDGKEKTEAMKLAITGAASSIASSAMTTVVGLLALVFMSFKIGADMGIVLAKGVFISMLSIFTLLPTLILLFDKLIKKTTKKVLPLPTAGLSRFSYRFRYIITGVFVVLFITMFFLKGNSNITYTMTEKSEVEKVFSKDNPIIFLYDNNDEAAAGKLSESLSDKAFVKNISAYSTTLGKPYTAEEMLPVLTGQFSMFSSNVPQDTSSSPAGFKQDTNGLSSDFTLQDESSLSVDQLLNSTVINMIYYDFYHGNDTRTLSLAEFLPFLQTYLQENPAIAEKYDSQMLAQLQMVGSYFQPEDMLVQHTAAELAAMFTPMGNLFSENDIELMYRLYYSSVFVDSTFRLSIEQLFNHVLTMASSEVYASFIDPSMLAPLSEVQKSLEEGKKQLQGEHYSLMMISTRLPEESVETNDFLKELNTRLEQDFKGNYYLIGNSPMQYEMSLDFHSEMNKISIITIIAIFVVVLLTFRSITIPTILVLLIQAAVFSTMVIMNLVSGGMYYLALLMVQSILMGATIDYAILFSSYYREKRQTQAPKEALSAAYEGSIHTILTSGLIMVLVTWILGYIFPDPAIGQICHIIAMGAACAIVLILFVLPGVLSTFDRLITRFNRFLFHAQHGFHLLH